MKKFVYGPSYREWLEQNPDISLTGMAWAMFWRGMILMYGFLLIISLAIGAFTYFSLG